MKIVRTLRARRPRKGHPAISRFAMNRQGNVDDTMKISR